VLFGRCCYVGSRTGLGRGIYPVGQGRRSAHVGLRADEVDGIKVKIP
jgi:hypothetical protein